MILLLKMSNKYTEIKSYDFIKTDAYYVTNKTVEVAGWDCFAYNKF